jgi:hypothetical protein
MTAIHSLSVVADFMFCVDKQPNRGIVNKNNGELATATQFVATK